MIKRPPRLETFAQRYFWQTKFLAPFGHGHAAPVGSVPYGCSAVAALLFLCGPYTITWVVPAVIILALYAVLSRWPRTHVSIEGRERLSPFRAYGNTSASIIGVFGILTARQNTSPNIMFRRARSAMAYRFPFASAGKYCTPTQPGCERCTFSAAVAQTQPNSFTVKVGRHVPHSREHIKSGAGYVN